MSNDTSCQTIKVEKVLTEDEFYFDLDFPLYDENEDWIEYDPPQPGYFDDNLDDWIKFWYSQGYRMVKLYDTSSTTIKDHIKEKGLFLSDSEENYNDNKSNWKEK